LQVIDFKFINIGVFRVIVFATLKVIDKTLTRMLAY